MSLRARLMLAYAFLMLLLIGGSGAAAAGFREIAVLMHDRLEHFVSVTSAADDLLRALDTHHDTALAIASGSAIVDTPVDHERAADEIDDALARLSRLADGEESRPLGDARRRIEAYRRADVAFFDSPTAVSVAAYLAGPAREFRAARAVADALAIEGHRHIEDTSESLGGVVQRKAALLGALLTLGLLVVVAVARSLRTHVIDRLEALHEFGMAIERGQTERRIDVEGHDELAQVGRLLNRILDGQQELEANLRGSAAREKQLLLGLLSHGGGRVVLYDVAGELAATTDSGLSDDVLAAIGAEAHAHSTAARRVIAGGHGDASVVWSGPEGERVTISPLAVGERMVGWIAVVC